MDNYFLNPLRFVSHLQESRTIRWILNHKADTLHEVSCLPNLRWHLAILVVTRRNATRATPSPVRLTAFDEC
jgi:hypothetical protein